jgi:hypothetical protein
VPGILYQSGALWSLVTLAEEYRPAARRVHRSDPAQIREIAALKLALVGLKASETSTPIRSAAECRSERDWRARWRSIRTSCSSTSFRPGLDPISSRLLDDLILELRANLGAIDRCDHRFGRTRESPTRIRQSVWVATPSRDPTRSALARQRRRLCDGRTVMKRPMVAFLNQLLLAIRSRFTRRARLGVGDLRRRTTSRWRRRRFKARFLVPTFRLDPGHDDFFLCAGAETRKVIPMLAVKGSWIETGSLDCLGSR